jgi:hypothetical protein
MKTGKKIALLLLMVLNFGSLSGQSSKNSRKEYVAVDNHTYKRGEAISFGSPSRGKTYGTILIKDIVTVRDYIDTMNGTEIGKKEAVNATEEDLAKLTRPIIKTFKEEMVDGKVVKYAILRYTDKKEIVIAIDDALRMGEVVSQTADFQTVADKMKTSETNTNQENGTIKSFSPKFEVKLLSVIGNKVEQTVTLEFLISHKLVHQNVCFVDSDNSSFNYIANGIRAYDFEGNEYLVKTASIGKKVNFLFSVCNKIPTEVPMKASVTFKQILPSVKGLSFVSIVTSFGAYDDWKTENKNLEVSNVSINWQ